MAILKAVTPLVLHTSAHGVGVKIPGHFSSSKSAMAAKVGAGVHLPDPIGAGGILGIEAAAFFANQISAQEQLVSLPHLKIRAGDHCALILSGIFRQHLVLGRIIGKDDVACLIGDNDGRGLIGGKLQVHSHLLGIAFGPVHCRAHGNDSTTVDIGAHVAVQTGVGCRIGRGNHTPSADHQVAIGIDTVTLTAKTGNNMHIAAQYGGNGYAILIGIDAVILRADADGSVANGQVHLAV